MISARADKKVCPVFLRLRPVFLLRGTRFFYIYQTKSPCLCIFLFFSEKTGFISF